MCIYIYIGIYIYTYIYIYVIYANWVFDFRQRPLLQLKGLKEAAA